MAYFVLVLYKNYIYIITSQATRRAPAKQQPTTATRPPVSFNRYHFIACKNGLLCISIYIRTIYILLQVKPPEEPTKKNKY